MAQTIVAIYARVSSQDQKERQTIQSQLSTLSQYAKEREWEVFKVYSDEGISGSYIENRPAFRELMQDLEDRKFSIILCAEHSRITRSDDPLEQATIESLLKVYNVKIISPTEGTLDPSTFEGGLITVLKMRMASAERQRIAERVRRGRLEALKNGRYVLNSLPYGFKKITNKDVKPTQHKVLIDTEEARVLRHVYDMIVNDGASLDDCIADLNTKNIKTRKGKSWSSGNLSSILRNSSLTGTIYTNKHKFKMVPGKHKTKYELVGLRPKEEWVPVPVPPIFTDEEYTLLRKAIDNKRKYCQVKLDGTFLLRGKLRCGQCGKKYVPTSGGNVKDKIVKYYACAGRTISPKRVPENYKKCDAPFVNMQLLDEHVYTELFINLINNPKETLHKWLQDKSTKQDYLEHLQAKLDRIQNEMVTNSKRVESLVDLYTSQDITKDLFRTKKSEIDGHRALLEEDKEQLEEQIADARAKKERNESLKQGIVTLENARKIIGMVFVNPPFKVKRKLIEALLPEGSYIEIVKSDEIRYIKPRWSSRRLKVDWDYVVKGSVNINAIIRVLKEDYKCHDYGVCYSSDQ